MEGDTNNEESMELLKQKIVRLEASRTKLREGLVGRTSRPFCPNQAYNLYSPQIISLYALYWKEMVGHMVCN